MGESMDGGRAIDLIKTIDRVKVESEVKLKFFMVGLIFAILSFSVQNPLKEGELWLRGIEALSWVFLSGSGLFAIKDIGGFSVKESRIGALSNNGKTFMWFCFLAGLYGLMAVKMLAHIFAQN